MRRSLLHYSAALTILVTLVVAGASGCTAWRVWRSAALAAESEPFEQRDRSPGEGGGRMLVVGDSTAVGTGASSPDFSVAGLIGLAHPGLNVVNLARDGARFADIARQLPGAGDFDVILVLGGGNDVIRLTGRSRLAEGVRRTLFLARQLAPVVVLLPSGNVGNAPFFFPPWSWWMTQRSRELHEIARDEAAQSGAIYVNVFAEHELDPFARQPRLFHAVDGLHPSDAGYRLWYEELNRQAALDQRLKSLLAKRSGALRP